MKVRTITLGIHLDTQSALSGSDGGSIPILRYLIEKLTLAKKQVTLLKAKLTSVGYDVQTLRLSCNSFEEWMIPALSYMPLNVLIGEIDSLLQNLEIDFFSIGPACSESAIKLLPDILCTSTRISASCLISVPGTTDTFTVPQWDTCRLAAETCLTIYRRLGDLANFRYCASFHCGPGIPFFPASYHDSDNRQSTASVGFENGDLLFLAFFSSADLEQAHTQLIEVLGQAYKPIQVLLESACEELGIHYGGIDASMNPGLLIQDSVGAGIELLLKKHLSGNAFGQSGTLAAVATITTALKALEVAKGIKLVGYSGLMLPVMEDIILSERAANESGSRYTARDLLLFSSVCGVGLDTLPIPGDTSVDAIASMYTDVGAMAHRLRKPLSCRLLPMNGKQAGDITEVQSPYLCNTTVFQLS